VKYSLNPDEYRNYVRLVKNYHLDCNYKVLIESLQSIFQKNCHKVELYQGDFFAKINYLRLSTHTISGFARFVKPDHKAEYQKFLQEMR
jgi:hypothetical protein